MSACFDVLNLYANSPPKTPKEFASDVLTARQKWDRTEQKNALWLKKIAKEISEVRGEFRMITSAIFDAIGKQGTSFRRWKEFSDAYGVATKALRDLIPISSLEETIKEL